MKRKIFTGTAHFVTFSAYGRRKLLSTPAARQIVISQLGKLVSENKVHISGFVIMPDHVHAILWFDDDRLLPEVIRIWKAGSSHHLHELYRREFPSLLPALVANRSGRMVTTFWQRRYYDFNLSSPEKALEKLNYIHNNPVKQGLASSPEGWVWSSARWYGSGKSVGIKLEPLF
jgi:putative transposase